VQRTLALLSQGDLLETHGTPHDTWSFERNLLPEPDW
jgi:hypothetical protein